MTGAEVFERIQAGAMQALDRGLAPCRADVGTEAYAALATYFDGLCRVDVVEPRRSDPRSPFYDPGPRPTVALVVYVDGARLSVVPRATLVDAVIVYDTGGEPFVVTE